MAALADPVLDTLAREAVSHGVRALVVPTDITRRDEIDVLVAKTLVEFGRIDILINSAGIGSSPSICDSTDNDLEKCCRR